MEMSKIDELRAENNGKLPDFTWPGAYPMYYINDSNQVLCSDCANKGTHDVVNGEPNWENDSLYCDDCGKKIESAYGVD